MILLYLCSFMIFDVTFFLAVLSKTLSQVLKAIFYHQKIFFLYVIAFDNWYPFIRTVNEDQIYQPILFFDFCCFFIEVHHWALVNGLLQQHMMLINPTISEQWQWFFLSHHVFYFLQSDSAYADVNGCSPQHYHFMNFQLSLW